MQTNFEMAGIHHQRNQQPQVEQQHQQQQQRFIVDNASTSSSTSSPFFPLNQNYHHHFPPQQQHLHQIQQHLPFTQQFFQYPHYRSSTLDPQQQQTHQEVSPFFPLNFKLGMENNNNSIDEQEEDALVRGSERYCTEPRQTSLAVSHCWQNQEDSAIKLPFWKPLCPEFSNGTNTNNSKEGESKLQGVDQEMYSPEEIHPPHHQQQQQIIKSLEDSSKCRVLFGELEAIYATKADHDPSTQIASESDLPIDNVSNFPNQGNGATAIGSESASVGGKEAEAEKEVHKRKRRKKTKSSNSITKFFESLVKKLVNHQENLQKRLMETIERLDEERKEREEAWREQELAKVEKEAAARAHERTLSLNREAALVSYLEKLTGQKINFHEGKSCTTSNNNSLGKLRWPQEEVDALVQIRNGLESKCEEEEGGNKGVVFWEEVSKSMASIGFQRNARRCKEKWENMHKCSGGSSVKKTKLEITRQQLNSASSTVDFDHEKGEKIYGREKEDMEQVKE